MKIQTTFEFIQVNLLYLYMILKCTKFVESWKQNCDIQMGLGSDICVHNGDNETKADCNKGQSFMCRAVQKIGVHETNYAVFSPLLKNMHKFLHNFFFGFLTNNIIQMWHN